MIHPKKSTGPGPVMPERSYIYIGLDFAISSLVDPNSQIIEVERRSNRASGRFYNESENWDREWIAGRKSVGGAQRKFRVFCLQIMGTYERKLNDRYRQCVPKRPKKNSNASSSSLTNCNIRASSERWFMTLSNRSAHLPRWSFERGLKNVAKEGPPQQISEFDEIGFWARKRWRNDHGGAAWLNRLMEPPTT
jgi:hypothetical protein